MDVKRGYLLAVGVAVRRVPNIEPEEGNQLTGAVLVRALGEIDARPPQIEPELFAPVLRYERNRY